ncbi:hypothetical protein R1flu_015446 [Riccia fluitans]|uniref:Uncharacterized protein n=1 Tax=Riccia fluitans TaxID=41844 RepID=A0ABD1YJT9_9MARC
MVSSKGNPVVQQDDGSTKQGVTTNNLIEDPSMCLLLLSLWPCVVGVIYHEMYGNRNEMLVNINALATVGQTALHIAAACSRAVDRENGLVELLDHSPDVNISWTSGGRRALHMYLSGENGVGKLTILRNPPEGTDKVV